MTAGLRLKVENCLVANLPGDGIGVSANGASVLVTDAVISGNSGNGLLVLDGAHATVSRTTISGNGNTGVYALASLASTTTTAGIAETTIDSNSFAVISISNNVSAAVKVSVRNSQVVRTLTSGLISQSNTGGLTTLSASNNIVSNNPYGIVVFGSGAKEWASGNTVSDASDSTTPRPFLKARVTTRFATTVPIQPVP